MRNEPDFFVAFVAPAVAVPILRVVLKEVPSNIPGTILILLHRGENERDVVDNLNVSSSVLVTKGREGMPLRIGHAYVVNRGERLFVTEDCHLASASYSDADGQWYNEGGRADTYKALPEALLDSLARSFGPRVIAVALTRLDTDEKEGFRQIRTFGGKTIALDTSDRLWLHEAGPQVVPDVADELLNAKEIARKLQSRSMV